MNEWLQKLLGTQNYEQPEYAQGLYAALSPQFQGLHTPGNIDLNNRPKVFNPETGGHSTVWSMGIGLDDGKEALIPRVSDDGRILSEKEAIEQFKKTRKHLGVFHSKEAANDYAELLHRQQAQQYRGHNE
jgi:hypothetical protein